MKLTNEQVNQLLTIDLKHGGHKSFEQGTCAMEAVAYVTGEPFSDHPKCVCPVIAAFLRSWNDALGDEPRNRLIRPLLPLVVGTRGSRDLETRRANRICDWLIQVYTPAFLRLVPSLEDDAIALASCSGWQDENKPWKTAKDNAAAAWTAARNAARDAARNAARDAAGVAAGVAARAAARAAAGAAAWDAAGAAARAAAGAAARDAARDAAWDAARDAARVALEPTVTRLQASTIDLIKELCAMEDAQ